MEDIKNWLAGNRDWSTGRELYMQYGRNMNLRNLFMKKGPTKYNHGKLISELEAMVAGTRPMTNPGLPQVRFVDGNAKAVTQTVTRFSSSKTDEALTSDFKRFTDPKNRKIDPELLPEELKPVFVKVGEMTRKRSFLHSTLEFLPTDQERKASAEEIEKLSADIDSAWKKLDYFRDHGKMPEPKVPVEKFDSIALLQHRNNLRSQISKLKRKEGTAEFINELQSQIKEINDKLNGAI